MLGAAVVTLLAGFAHEAVAAPPIDSLQEVDSWEAVVPGTTQALAPLALALSPDREHLYAVTQEPGTMGTGDAQMLVFDTDTGDTVGASPLTVANDPSTHGFPTSIALSADGDTGYVTVSRANGNTVTAGTDRVEIVDLAQPTAPLPLGAIDTTLPSPYGVYDIVRVGDTLYASSRINYRVLAIDTLTNTFSSIFVGGKPTGLAVSPDESTVWAANRMQVKLVGVDASTNAVTSQLPIPLQGYESAAFVAASPDGESVYVTSAGSGSLARVELDTMSVIDPDIPTGCTRLAEIEIDRDGWYAYARCPNEDLLVIVDIDPMSPSYHDVAHAVDVDIRTNFGLVVDDEDDLRVYVSDAHSGSVVILEHTCPTGGLDSCAQLDACAALANKGQCISCVNQHANAWVSQGLISANEKQELFVETCG